MRFAGGRTYNIFHVDYTLGLFRNQYKCSGGASASAQGRPVYWNVMNTPGEVPLSSYSDIVNNKFATPDGYFNGYYTNPYWQTVHSRDITRQDNLLGSVLFDLKPSSWIDFSYRAGLTERTQNYNSYVDEQVTSSYYLNNPWGDGGYRTQNTDVLGNSQDWADNEMVLNGDFLITLNKKLGDLSAKLILGNDVNAYQYRLVNMGASQLEIPNFYNISNRIGNPLVQEEKLQRNSVGLFGDLTLGYKDFIFLHASGRNDWDSRLVASNRSFFYPGADLSIILSDAIPALKDNSFLSFAKLRAGVSKTGQVSLNNFYATLPSFISPTYNPSTLYTYGWGNGLVGFPYGSTVGFALNNALSNPTLKPEITQEIEAGLEVGFVQNRITLGVTGFQQNTTNQTIPASISASTGFTSAYINAGEMQNKGLELDLRLTPLIKADKFHWNLTVNYTAQISKVISLYPGLNSVSLGNANYAVVGQQFPQIMTNDFLRDSVGRIIVDPKTGFPLPDTKLKSFGHGNPNQILGLVNTFVYDRFTLTIVAEYRTGNVIFNAIGEDLDFTGTSWHSAVNNRQSFVIPNSSVPVVNPTTNAVTYVPNTNVVTQDGGYNLWTNSPAGQQGGNYITSAAFWKIREVSLTYDLPVEKLWGGRYVKAARLVCLAGTSLCSDLPPINGLIRNSMLP